MLYQGVTVFLKTNVFMWEFCRQDAENSSLSIDEEYPFSERDCSSDARHNAAGSCREVQCCLLVSVFVSNKTASPGCRWELSSFLKPR